MRINQLSLNSLLLLPLMVVSLEAARITEAGIMLGINFTNLWGGDLPEETSTKFGPSGGAYVILDLPLFIDLRIEGWYSEKGHEIISPGDVVTSEGEAIGSYTLQTTMNRNYVVLNVLEVVPFTEHISSLVGISFGIYQNGSWKTELVEVEGPTSDWLEDQTQWIEGYGDYGSYKVIRSDIGLLFGTRYHKGSVSLEARLDLGLTQVYRHQPGRNIAGQLIIGYHFGR